MEQIRKEDGLMEEEVTKEATMFFTRARQAMSPFLPPPILRIMQRVNANAQLRNVLGEEPAMTLTTMFLIMYALSWIMKLVAPSLSGKKVAVDGLDDDVPEGSVLSNLDKKSSTVNEEYSDSVVLFGPTNGGKSVLFHSLLTPLDTNISMTVVSLKANASVLRRKTNETQDIRQEAVQIVDYPGHISLSAHLDKLLYPKSNGDIRGLLVIDSTKSLGDAASLFYNTILTNSNLLRKWDLAYGKRGAILNIMVVCSKSDAPNSKNWRRVKIQLRSELEKLRKISSSVDSSHDAGHFTLTGKTIDLDNFGKNGLPFVKLSFQSLTCMGAKEGLDTLTTFIMSGQTLTNGKR